MKNSDPKTNLASPTVSKLQVPLLGLPTVIKDWGDEAPRITIDTGTPALDSGRPVFPQFGLQSRQSIGSSTDDDADDHDSSLSSLVRCLEHVSVERSRSSSIGLSPQPTVVNANCSSAVSTPSKSYLSSSNNMVRAASLGEQMRENSLDIPAKGGLYSISGKRCSLTPEVRRRRLVALKNLRLPTKTVTRVDSFSDNDGYVRLNQYKLGDELGQGSYGIVKLAYSEEDHNLYAMKILDKIKLTKKFAFFRKPPSRKNKGRVITAPDPLSQVHREIAILKKLKHPNVVKLVEVLDDLSDNYLYMVFEYVERGAVMEIPTDNPLSEDQAWPYFRDILMGLEYLHFQKIVHRDLKPSNLLLNDLGQIKIADFGVSSEFEGIDAFLTGTAGTPAFMAPEALIEDSAAFYSGRAQDIWALGITLYAFVCGQVPFWDAYVIALHKKIKVDPLKFPEDIELSDLLKDLIGRMLSKDPGLRYMLSDIKEHDWVTRYGTSKLPSEEANCSLITVTAEEIKNSVRVIPKLDTLILIKAMGQRKRFCHPFRALAEATRRSRQFTRPKSANPRGEPRNISTAMQSLGVDDLNRGVSPSDIQLLGDHPGMNSAS